MKSQEHTENFLTGHIPTIERVLLVTWLLKDFGWMTLDVYLGWTFGFISVMIHLMLFFFDPRRSYRFYNFSLLVWVCGNLIWMSIEFLAESPSSEFHVVTTPVGDISDRTEKILIDVKTVLFLISCAGQILMYILIFRRWIPTPEDEGEDIVSKNEAVLFFFGEKSFYARQNQSTDVLEQLEENDDDDLTLTNPNHSAGNPYYGITLALIENAYVILWVSKDLFWSWGTGDLTKGRGLAVMYEVIAMCFGGLAIMTYMLTAYLYRRNLVRFLDCITTIFWISANFVWMSGEFFLRYESLKLNDENQGDDGLTRMLSASLFIIGICLQVYVIIALYLPPNRYTLCLHKHIQQRKKPQIEMANVKVPVRYNNITYSPQHFGPDSTLGGFDDEETVLF